MVSSPPISSTNSKGCADISHSANRQLSVPILGEQLHQYHYYHPVESQVPDETMCIARYDTSLCIEITLFILFNVVNTVSPLVINAVYDFIYNIDLVIVLDLFCTVYPSHLTGYAYKIYDMSSPISPITNRNTLHCTLLSVFTPSSLTVYIPIHSRRLIVEYGAFYCNRQLHTHYLYIIPHLITPIYHNNLTNIINWTSNITSPNLYQLMVSLILIPLFGRCYCCVLEVQ